MKVKWSLIILTLSTLVVGRGAIGYVQSQMVRVDPAPVLAHHTRQLPSVVARGRLEPSGQVIHVMVPSRVSNARLSKVLVDEGVFVRAGQTLAILDGRAEHEAEVEQCEKRLLISQAELARVKAPAKSSDLSAQQSVVSRLQAHQINADREYDRYLALYREGAVSASVLDGKTLAVESIKQELNQANATLQSMSEVRPVDIDLACAQVENAHAAIKVARSQLDLDYVRAPISGQVIKIISHAGEVADERGILEMGDTARMYAVAEVYENDASKLEIGQRALIHCDACSQTIYGRIEQIGLKIEKKYTLDADAALDVDSRIIEARIKIDPQDSKRISRYTNSHVTVTISTGLDKHDLPRLASTH